MRLKSSHPKEKTPSAALEYRARMVLDNWKRRTGNRAGRPSRPDWGKDRLKSRTNY